MALKKCKECGNDVSTEADSCPKCGAVIKKKRGFLRLIGAAILIFITLIAIGSLINGVSDTKSTSPSSVKASVFDALAIDFTWSKDGFDNIMKGNFTIHNKSSHDIKDIEITCSHFAKSGTQIDRNTRTLFEIVKAGSTRKFADFNMGFIHSQTNTTSCKITDATVL
jgi:hypothetical protein